MQAATRIFVPIPKASTRSSRAGPRRRASAPNRRRARVRSDRLPALGMRKAQPPAAAVRGACMSAAAPTAEGDEPRRSRYAWRASRSKPPGRPLHPAGRHARVPRGLQGPLDLLLYLIRRQNLDILDIPVFTITQQYMAYIELMEDMAIELAGEYLLGAMLAEIKSRMLLPSPAADDGGRGPARRTRAPAAGIRTLQGGGRAPRCLAAGRARSRARPASAGPAGYRPPRRGRSARAAGRAARLFSRAELFSEHRIEQGR